MSKQKSIYGDLLQETSRKFIHKDYASSEITIMTGTYKIPWRRIVHNIGFANTIKDEILKLNKQFPYAHIRLVEDCVGWIIFDASGMTTKAVTDESNPKRGEAVARAKAAKLACSIALAIINAVEHGFTKEIKRARQTFTFWRKKKSEYIKRQ